MFTTWTRNGKIRILNFNFAVTRSAKLDLNLIHIHECWNESSADIFEEEMVEKIYEKEGIIEWAQI